MAVCSKCGEATEEGFVFGTKDGALSFASDMPSALRNAREAPGFIKLANLRAGGRSAVRATICRTCRTITISY